MYSLHQEQLLFFNMSPRESEQELVEPSNGLQKGLFLRELLNLYRKVATHGKPVFDAREEVDLIRLTSFLEDLLRLVALLGGEDGIGLGGRDGEGAGDGGELVLLDERGVGDVADVDAVLVVTDDVLAEEE